MNGSTKGFLLGVAVGYAVCKLMGKSGKGA